MYFPSEENRADQTTPRCASSVDSIVCCGQFQSRTEPSSKAIATVSLLGSKATDQTDPALAASTAAGSAEEAVAAGAPDAAPEPATGRRYLLPITPAARPMASSTAPADAKA